MKKRFLNLKAVIFDMDGVIVDSMPYHFLAWYEALRPWGVRVSCLDVYSKEGERWDVTLKGFLKKAGIKPAPVIIKRIFSLRQKIFKKSFKRFIFKGAQEFLLCLRNRGYLLGLVSGTPGQEIEKILPKGIQKLFDAIIAGDQVKRGKPHPEPYLEAALRLGVSPAQCLVIENAPLGIESAKRAGMRCVAITTSLPKEALGLADIVVDNLEDVFSVVDKSCSVKA